MNADAHLELERAQRLAHREAAADRTGGAIEEREETVARGVDLDTPESPQLPADDLVVRAEQRRPLRVAELAQPVRRADQVGERDRRQTPSDSQAPGARP